MTNDARQAMHRQVLAGFVMAASSTDSKGKDRDIRERLVGKNFLYTQILSCSLRFLDQGRPEQLRDEVLFIGVWSYCTAVDRTLNEWSEWQRKSGCTGGETRPFQGG